MNRIDCKKIRSLRMQSGMLVSHLAKELDLAPRVISRMENDLKYNPGVLTLYRLSEYFNIEIGDLIIKG
jgi:DNA-binding XRE family transcriptional regulator